MGTPPLLFKLPCLPDRNAHSRFGLHKLDLIDLEIGITTHQSLQWNLHISRFYLYPIRFLHFLLENPQAQVGQLLHSDPVFLRGFKFILWIG